MNAFPAASPPHRASYLLRLLQRCSLPQLGQLLGVKRSTRRPARLQRLSLHTEENNRLSCPHPGCE